MATLLISQVAYQESSAPWLPPRSEFAAHELPELSDLLQLVEPWNAAQLQKYARIRIVHLTVFSPYSATYVTDSVLELWIDLPTENESYETHVLR